MKFPILTPETGRSVMTIAMMLSGIFCYLTALLLVMIVWLGSWTDAQEHLRLYILGGGLAGFLAGSMFVQIAMALGGPLGRVKFNASRDGVGIEASDDAAASVTVATEVNVNPPSCSPC